MYRPRSFSHDTKKCDTHVYISLFQPVVRRKQLVTWPNTLAKRLKTLKTTVFLHASQLVLNLVTFLCNSYLIEVLAKKEENFLFALTEEKGCL